MVILPAGQTDTVQFFKKLIENADTGNDFAFISEAVCYTELSKEERTAQS